jgi:cellulose synthase/poly-beta-1,6-N-acetylglucosamine synthase-like glycosyltransferase
MSGESSAVPSLIASLASEVTPPCFELQKVIVVASGCVEDTLRRVMELAKSDPRILLMVEPKRTGKIAALNKIIRCFQGEFLVLVNSDAIPMRGSISRLLQAVAADARIGAASGCPTFNPKGDLTSKVLDLMWTSHNVSSRELNHMRQSNHSSDELIAIRSSALSQLPDGVINDGAYMGGHAFSSGYRLVFCEDARVMIDVPSRLYDLIQQRRRILFGHRQVTIRLGRMPRTIESLMVTSPLLGVRLLSKCLCSKPELIVTLPFALVTETLAMMLSIFDRISNSDRHLVWRRYNE